MQILFADTALNRFYTPIT